MSTQLSKATARYIRNFARKRSKRRIFCIGLNKTGTSSLHHFFQLSGLDSHHGVEWTKMSYLSRPGNYFQIADCYSDGERPDFRRLQKNFPEAIFILTVREERAWLHSRIKHVFRNHSSMFVEEGKVEELGNMARMFLVDPILAIDTWLQIRKMYHKEVRHFFKDNHKFLEIDVTTNEEWPSVISEFLRRNGTDVNSVHRTPFANKRSNFENIPVLEKYLTIADERISAINASSGQSTDEEVEVLNSFFRRKPELTSH